MLTSGLYADAITVFRSTLEHLVYQVELPDDSPIKLDDHTSDIIIETVSCGIHDSPNDCFDSNSFFYYDKAFLICGAYDGSAFLTARQHNQASVAVIYNMALSFHLLASHSTTNQHSNLIKALKLYEMAYDANSKNEDGDIGNLFFICILNNIGSIYSFLFHTDRTQHCLEGILRILRQCYDFQGLICEEDISHFRMNVALLYGPGVQLAPAA